MRRLTLLFIFIFSFLISVIGLSKASVSNAIYWSKYTDFCVISTQLETESSKEKIFLTLSYHQKFPFYLNESVTGGRDVIIDPRLRVVYSDEYLENVKKTNPFLIRRWNYYLDNSFFLISVPEEKKIGFPEIVIEDIDNINIYKLERTQSMTRDFKKRTFYRIAGSELVIVFYSGEEFNIALNKHLKRNPK